MQTIEWKFKDITKEYPILKNQKSIENPTMFYKKFLPLFKNETKEFTIVFWLSVHKKVTGFEIVSIGNLYYTIMSPREIFRGAVINHCHAIIIAHNHPSGNSDPSKQDISITKKLVKAGKILDIEIIDHIIFGNKNYYSFVEHRII